MKRNTLAQRQFRIGRLIELPHECHRMVRVMFDDFNSKPDGQNTAAAYDLWTFLAELYPEVQTGDWSLEFIGPWQVRIIERIPV